MTELDRQLEGYLTGMVNTLLDAGAPFVCPRNATAQQLQAAVKTLHAAPPSAQLFENIKFARLMKGRLWFYGQAVLWFDSRLLIRNELNRIRKNFYETPLRLFAKLVYGRDVTAEEALGDVFDKDDAEACRRFAELARPECPAEELKPRALEIAAVFDPFLCAMEKLLVKHDRRS
jgi:hypothetical protein